MKWIGKEEMHDLSLEELENTREILLRQLNGNRRIIRNVLFELLGVIDIKKKELTLLQ